MLLRIHGTQRLPQIRILLTTVHVYKLYFSVISQWRIHTGGGAITHRKRARKIFLNISENKSSV